MEDKEYALDILLHYYLNEEGKHTMDGYKASNVYNSKRHFSGPHTHAKAEVALYV